MTTSRDMHAEVMRPLESMKNKLDAVKKLEQQNSEHLRRIVPQKTVKPVPRPRQGTQMVRGTSVTRYLRQFTKDKNAGRADGERLYEEFSEDIDDKQYNTDAMNCLEWILGLHLGSNLGVMTWEQVCKHNPGKMGLIVRDAVNAPELKVFAQAAGQWAIQMLIINKMNSRIRYQRDHKSQQPNQAHVSFAPMAVPDIGEGNILPPAEEEQEDEISPVNRNQHRPCSEIIPCTNRDFEVDRALDSNAEFSGALYLERPNFTSSVFDQAHPRGGEIRKNVRSRTRGVARTGPRGGTRAHRVVSRSTTRSRRGSSIAPRRGGRA